MSLECHVMGYHVMEWNVMECRGIERHGMSCYGMECHVMEWNGMENFPITCSGVATHYAMTLCLIPIKYSALIIFSAQV